MTNHRLLAMSSDELIPLLVKRMRASANAEPRIVAAVGHGRRRGSMNFIPCYTEKNI